jgi:hypothetical protein
MPAGILSDMIQQYKAIFEGEPIELVQGAMPISSQTSPDLSRSEPPLVDIGQNTDAETQKRGNRNSMIYATNTDVLLNSVGREFTGKNHGFTMLGWLEANSRAVIHLQAETGDAEESDGGEIVAFEEDDDYPLSSPGGSPAPDGPAHRDLYRISEAGSLVSPRIQASLGSPGLPKSPRFADVTEGFKAESHR